MIQQDNILLPAFIFDLDGVLANNSQRQHLLRRSGDTKPSRQDWLDFFNASPFDGVYSDTAKLFKTLQAAGYKILICTGRSEDYEEMTRDWLESWGLLPDQLFQRRHLDFRKDFEVKEEIYLTQIQPYYQVLGVFEDRADCVRMWRARELTCYQPREASY